VVVSEVRETSRKPDEMYALLERLSPGTRKLEVRLLPLSARRALSLSYAC
jgi:N6-adenosine-specific RNA methylase IME4